MVAHEVQRLRKRKRAPSGARLEVGAKIARVTLATVEAENGPGKRGLNPRVKMRLPRKQCVSGNGEGMLNYEDWLDDQPAPAKKLPALVVAPIHGVLPFAGKRNPLTRSDTVKRVSAAIATPMSGGVRQVYHFDGESEYAVALDALRSPDLYGLEVQLDPVEYFCRKKRRMRSHHFDLRLTFKDGYRRAVFVRNGTSLARPETQDEIDDILAYVTDDFADDTMIVCADSYRRAYRDNLRRIWDYLQVEDDEADAIVEDAARTSNYWYLSDLIANCDLECWRCYQAALRLIGQNVLWTDMHGVIDYPSRVALNG